VCEEIEIVGIAMFEVEGSQSGSARQIKMFMEPGVAKECDENLALEGSKNVRGYGVVHRLSAYSQRALTSGGSRS
jgi:hypothetical protein